MAATVIAAAPSAVALDAGASRVELAPPASLGGPSLGDRVAALSSEERIYLVLHDLHSAAQPGVLYHLYLDLPPRACAGADVGSEPGYLGSLNFFDAVARTLPMRSYDVTSLLREMQDRGLLSEPLTVTIRPTGDPASAARPVLGRVELVVQ